MLQVISRDGVPLRTERVRVQTTSCILINDPLNPGQTIQVRREVSESEHTVLVDDASEPKIVTGIDIEESCKNYRKVYHERRNQKELK